MPQEVITLTLKSPDEAVVPWGWGQSLLGENH